VTPDYFQYAIGKNPHFRALQLLNGWYPQVDQGDIDSGKIINIATVKSTSPQNEQVDAAASSEVPLVRTFGIAIGEFQNEDSLSLWVYNGGCLVVGVEASIVAASDSP